MNVRPLSRCALLAVAASLLATPLAMGATWRAEPVAKHRDTTPITATLKYHRTKLDRRAMRAHHRALKRRKQAAEHRAAQVRYLDQIAKIEGLITDAELQEAQLREELEARLIEIYKTGDSAEWNAILNAGSFDAALEQARLLDDQQSRDVRLALEHQRQVERLEDLREVLYDLRDREGTAAQRLEQRADHEDGLLVAAANAHLDDQPKLTKDSGASGTWLIGPATSDTMLSPFAWSPFGGSIGGQWDGGTRTPTRPATPEQIARVLSDPRITIYAGGIEDVRAGRIDGRLLDALLGLADRFGTVNITSLMSGHGVYTTSGNVSEHTYGCAADIGSLSGIVIQPSTQGPGSITEQGVRFLAGLQGDLAPHQVISLYSYGGPTMALADHYNHIHVGYSCS